MERVVCVFRHSAIGVRNTGQPAIRVVGVGDHPSNVVPGLGDAVVGIRGELDPPTAGRLDLGDVTGWRTECIDLGSHNRDFVAEAVPDGI